MGEGFLRVSECAGVEDAGLGRAQAVDIDPEQLLRVIAIGDIEAWIARTVGRDREEEPAVVRHRAGVGCKRDDDLEATAVGGRRGGCLRVRGGGGRRRGEDRGGGEEEKFR